MRVLICVTLLCVLGAAEGALAADEALTITIAVAGGHDGNRTVRQRDGKGRFHVLVTNVSGQTQRVWQEWCSWGYYALRFKITDEAGKTWVAKKRRREWTRNFPDWWTLQPGEHLVVEVDFADRDVWDGFPHIEKWSKRYTVQAVFEVAPDDRTKEHDIWTGRIVSDPLEIAVYL